MVDWVVRLLFRHPYFPDVRFPSVLLAVVGARSGVCLKPHRELFAARLSVGCPSALRNCSRTGGTGWCRAVYPRAEHRSCQGVQQYSLQPGVTGQQYGAGPPLASFSLGESPCHSGHHSSFHCKERASDLYPVDAWSLCRSGIPAWPVTSSRRGSVSPVSSGRLVRFTLACSVCRTQTDGSTGGH